MFCFLGQTSDVPNILTLFRAKNLVKWGRQFTLPPHMSHYTTWPVQQHFSTANFWNTCKKAKEQTQHCVPHVPTNKLTGQEVSKPKLWWTEVHLVIQPSATPMKMWFLPGAFILSAKPLYKSLPFNCSSDSEGPRNNMCPPTLPSQWVFRSILSLSLKSEAISHLASDDHHG